MFYKIRDHILPAENCALAFNTYPADEGETEEHYMITLVLVLDIYNNVKRGFSLKVRTSADLRSAKASIMGKIAAGKQLVDIDDIVATWCNKAEEADDGRKG